jgi:fatty acid kinase
MGPAGSLSASDLARVVRTYRDALGDHRATLNQLNVYPVPDGDTGTNMALTVDAVVRELAETEADGRQSDLGSVATSLSHGSLMGARGNSGVILSQVLRGMAGAFRDTGSRDGAGASVGPAELAAALARASASAYAAVSNPVEGTILSVAKAASQGAARCLEADPGASLAQVLETARADASEALAKTTSQLPALRAAGVVDAGGAGLLLLFDSFLHVVEGSPIEAPPAPPLTGAAPSGRLGTRDDLGHEEHQNDEPTDLRYEVMFFLEAADESIPAFRSVWASYGGSIVIVGGNGLYKCHIHTDEIGGAIEAAIEIGRPREIQVTDLAEQVEEERWVRDAAASGSQEEPPDEPVVSAVVAVASGEGVKRIFRSLGARQIVSGGQSANPSTEEILAAIAACSAEQVVVLPNNRNVVAAAEQAAAHSAKKVRVLPTAGIPEGFAALLAYDPEADLDTNADNMAAAAKHVIAGEVAPASRPAVTAAGSVEEGDWLGISRERIEVVAHRPATAADAAIALLDVLVSDAGDHEIVTVIEGEGAHAGDTRRILEWLADERPGTAAEVHHGGQPVYPYLFSIE